MRIKIPAMRATIGWNAGWNGISTLRMGEKGLFWESKQPYTIAPHNFALRVGADASRGEIGLKTVRGMPVRLMICSLGGTVQPVCETVSISLLSMTQEVASKQVKTGIVRVALS
jgi:hypothetical protein